MNKAQLRDHYKKIRAEISDTRRQEAVLVALNKIKSLLKPYKHILSYSSLPQELDMHLINEYLCQTHTLVLPRVQKKKLLLYHVERLDHLEIGHYKNLEPNPLECQIIDPSEIECALIPALAIDSTGNRLGYGLGFYDKLLSVMPQAYTICPILQEQLSPTPLPKQDHDILLNKPLML